MKIKPTISTKNVFQEKADAYLLFVQKQKKGSTIRELVANHLRELSLLYPHVEHFLQKRSFSGAFGDLVVLPIVVNDVPAFCIIAGIGESSKNCVEQYRRTLAQAVRTALSYGVESIAVALPDMMEEMISLPNIARETIITAKMTLYAFDDFLTQEGSKRKRLHNMILCVKEDSSDLEHAIFEGVLVGDAVNKARYFVDMPPSHMTPSVVANHAETIAKSAGISSIIYNYDDIKKLSMGGLHAVARGSVEEPRFVKLEYKPKHAINTQPILLVGKGITFDSGGLSIKPAGAMETMKDDMAGAAAVIMAISVAAHLDLPLHIVSLAPLTENMPSGTATKPGDVITFYSGKTAEVKNTDAEGRLILADALSYGIKTYNPEVVIDLATLTGACAHALGPFFSGLFSENESLVEEIINAGQKSGDYVWRLPMGQDYRKAIKSNIADICNIGDSRVKAGGSTAAHFLEHFVGDTPWAHLDIAGSAFDVPGIAYYAPGATGVGVRLLVEFLKKRAKNN